MKNSVPEEKKMGGRYLVEPLGIDKYLYINKTPTWYIRFVYLLGIFSWLLTIYAYIPSIVYDPFYRYAVAPILFIFSVYNLSSFCLALFYKRFDLQGHQDFIKNFWDQNKEPSVDVFLPICGEEIEVLENTWRNVSALKYGNVQVYVLDDSKELCREHEKMAHSYGFKYIERPNKGETKKAGNMKYAFERTSGDFILVLDGDFAPHPDFLKEAIPYMREKGVGIIQTPQYFGRSKDMHRRSALAYGSARAQEVFYRIIQVARDRLDGTHCCGTCAVYRRAALNSIGGFVQMSHSEDAHTGYGLVSKGWTIKYLPVILSIGECPDDAHMFFHQQHRWCLGNLVLTFDKKFWKRSIPLKTKFCYVTGFFYNIHYPFLIFSTFQLFWTLLKYSDYISFSGSYLFLPYLFFSIYCLLLLPILPFRWGQIYADFLKSYSNAHAIFSMMTNMSVAWIPTGAKVLGVSRAFRQALMGVTTYVFAYIVLFAFTVRYGAFRLFSPDHYLIQFWIFYNLFFSSLLLFQMYKSMDKGRRTQVSDKNSARSYAFWKLRTAGLFCILTLVIFVGIVFY